MRRSRRRRALPWSGMRALAQASASRFARSAGNAGCAVYQAAHPKTLDKTKNQQENRSELFHVVPLKRAAKLLFSSQASFQITSRWPAKVVVKSLASSPLQAAKRKRIECAATDWNPLSRRLHDIRTKLMKISQAVPDEGVSFNHINPCKMHGLRKINHENSRTETG